MFFVEKMIINYIKYEYYIKNVYPFLNQHLLKEKKIDCLKVEYIFIGCTRGFIRH